MTIEETRELILKDDTFVLEEVKKLQKIYKLKYEIRYAQKRTEGDLTESVAEHTWGMHVIADYFLLLEDSEASWDKQKISSMITWHDADEIITGDIISYEKAMEHSINEREIRNEVLTLLPETLTSSLNIIFDEYAEKHTIESKFVKAIDKIEGYIQMYQSGYEPVLHSFGRSQPQSHTVIGQHVKRFPYINRFYKVLDDVLDKEGYFVKL